MLSISLIHLASAAAFTRPLPLGRSNILLARQAFLRSATPLCQVFTRSGQALETASSLNEGGPEAIEYGGIKSVGVIVENAKDALKFYTDVFLMEDVSSSSQAPCDQPGASVRIGEQVIHLMEVPNPGDPIDVDPTYNMSAPPKGYVAKGRPVHAGRDRHVAITLHALEPLKASLEASGTQYTMSMSGRQALFTRDHYGNGWEFGPPSTYEKATRLFPPYLAPAHPSATGQIGWGGIPHVGLLVTSTPHAKVFYCDVLGMAEETDLRPIKLPFAGLFLRCGEQQVHILELPIPDPATFETRPTFGKDRHTTYTVKSLEPVVAALEGEMCRHFFGEKWPYELSTTAAGARVLYTKDYDANELMLLEDPNITPIAEASNGPQVPWTRLW